MAAENRFTFQTVETELPSSTQEKKMKWEIDGILTTTHNMRSNTERFALIVTKFSGMVCLRENLGRADLCKNGF